MTTKKEYHDRLAKADTDIVEIKKILMEINCLYDLKGHQSLMDRLLKKSFTDEKDLRNYCSCFINEYV